MDVRLDGKVALVTGSTSGIGRAIAGALAASGASVFVSGRDVDHGAEVVAGIVAAGGTASFIGADLGEGAAAVRDLADAVLEKTGGRLHVLVNNAARLSLPAPTAEIEAEDLAASLTVNVAAPFLLTGLLAPRIAASGGGAIVNIGSINGLVGFAGSALYSMTKAALHSLTKSWAAEYAASGIRVNTVAPGPTRTELNDRMAERLAPILARMPDHRLGELEEVADAVVFLASDHARHIQGAVLTVDGGFAIS